MKNAGIIIFVAMAYYLTGRLGLLLAIPPGFATAVWPPSGIALAALLLYGYRCVPGVFIGSFLINIFIAFDISTPDKTVVSLLVAGGIAAGATMQAAASAWLVQRTRAWPTNLEKPKEIAKVLLWGGPVGCIINATISTTLISAVSAGGGAFAFQWLTWWAGDIVGVFVFTPVLLLVFGNSNEISWSRKLITSLSLALVFALAVSMFALASKWERDKREVAFMQDAGQVARLIEKDIMSYLMVLDTTQGFFNASTFVSKDEFSSYTGIFFDSHPGLRSLSWNQKVDDSNRARFEKWARAEISPGFGIKDREPDRRLVAAKRRPLYFPVTYINSSDGNSAALGYDTYGPDPVDGNVRRIALDRARDLGATCMTGRLTLVQDEKPEHGLLLFRPVFAKAPAAKKNGALMGYVTGVFLIRKMIEASLVGAKNQLEIMEISVIDIDSTHGQQLLFETAAANKDSQSLAAELFEMSFRIDVAQHRWLLQMKERHQPGQGRYNWNLWAVLIGGLLITGVLSAFLLSLTGHTASVQREVADKTRSLEQLTEKLMRSNTELERFAYVASHDMQEPIRMIASFGTLLTEMSPADRPEKEKQYLGFVTDSAVRLQAMLEDLLEYARFSAVGQKFVDVDLNKTLDFALQNLTAAIADRDAKITRDQLPIVSGNPFQLTRLLQNLLFNALHYHKDGVPSLIHVSAADKGDAWQVSISDNGNGIPTEYLTRIFEPFKRLHTWHEKKGTGLGLAICKTIVEAHGGRIWATSEPGVGSVFSFTIPKKTG